MGPDTLAFFLAATAALEVQMLVCLSVRHTNYSCTTADYR